MKTDLFQSCGHCWVFQICWHIEWSTFTFRVSSFRIWNSSSGIPSPLLALFVVMLSKVHLTSHSRMSGLGEWSHHHDYLDLKIFFVQFCVFLPPFLNIFCFCSVHTFSVLYWAYLWMKYSLHNSNFLEELLPLTSGFWIHEMYFYFKMPLYGLLKCLKLYLFFLYLK